jgi:hypothetical protein
MTLQSPTGNLQIKYTVGRIFRTGGRVYAPTDGIHSSSVPPYRAGASLRPAPAPLFPVETERSEWRVIKSLEAQNET